MCPGRSDPFYIASYCIKWVTTSWTYSTSPRKERPYVFFINENFTTIDTIDTRGPGPDFKRGPKSVTWGSEALQSVPNG